ncbi:uroplakin-3a [Phaethornis superciliosus]
MPKCDKCSSLVTENNSKPLNSTFQQTNRQQLGPYKAALFNVPNCASPPKLAGVGDVNKVSDVLKQYLFRVGDDGTCFYNSNFLAVYHPPLAPDTTYRFKYMLVDSTEGVMKDQTLWSDPIKTRKVKLPMKIATWPGHRSGGMTVFTSVLSVLLFLLLAGLFASVFFCCHLNFKEFRVFWGRLSLTRLPPPSRLSFGFKARHRPAPHRLPCRGAGCAGLSSSVPSSTIAQICEERSHFSQRL